MLYKIRKAVTYGTDEKTLEEERLKISRGIIRQWFIYAPLEGANLLKIKVFHGDHQLLPYNRDQYILPSTFNNTPIEEHYEVFQPPYELVVKAWNEDTKKNHEYNLHVNVVPESVFAMRGVGPGLIERAKSLFGWD